MRKSRFTIEQIVRGLQEWDAGEKPGELARRHGVTETTRRFARASTHSPCCAHGRATGDCTRWCEREGMRVNRKLVQRVYREEGLSVRRRHRKRVAVVRVPIAPPAGRNERWNMDFVSDALADGRKFRSLTIVDEYTRE